MKKVFLALLFVSFLACSFVSRAYTSEDVVISCQIVTNDIQSMNTFNEPEFEIVVMSFSEYDNSVIKSQNFTARSCVEILSNLVNTERFEMKGISSPHNGTAYTLLQRN